MAATEDPATVMLDLASSSMGGAARGSVVSVGVDMAGRSCCWEP